MYILFLLSCNALRKLVKVKIHLYTQLDICLSGICLTTDLDFYLHMNNARYLRECDFGRYMLWLQNGVYSAVTQKGGIITLGRFAVA